VIDRLRAQTIRREMEVVIVAPARGRSSSMPAVAAEFAAVRVVPVASIWPMSVGRAAACARRPRP
jgi:hypothetical protein